jgi:hypothetical protein
MGTELKFNQILTFKLKVLNSRFCFQGFMTIILWQIFYDKCFMTKGHTDIFDFFSKIVKKIMKFKQVFILI